MSFKTLIVELNPYHGEILPGLHDLFKRSGCEQVDVLMREEVAKEKPFVKVPVSDRPTIFSGSLEYVTEFLRNEVSQKYDIILFATNVLWEANVNVSSIFRYLGFIPSAKIGTFFIEHNLSYMDTDDSTLLFEDDRLAALLPYEHEGKKIRMINPHYYGDVKTKNEMNDKVRIVVVGTTNKMKYVENLIYHAVRQHKDRNFEIRIINGNADNVPPDLSSFITVTPRLKFKEYYQELEEADFLLTLFLSDNPDLDKYLKGTTSGTVQTSLGFRTPMIIDELHAGCYGLTDNDSVIFPFNDLATGIEKALSLKKGKYSRLCRELGVLSERMDNESVSNIKEIIDIMHRKGPREVAAIDRETMSIAEKNKTLERLRIENEQLKSKVEEQDVAIGKLKQEAQELRHHVNELWVHLHSKRFVLVNKVYDRINQIAPHGTFRRRVGKMPLKAMQYVKQSPERKLERQKNEFREAFKKKLLAQASVSESVIIYISMPWDNIMRQRPHHIAQQLAELGHLIVYMDYEADMPKRISENLVVVDGTWCFDLLKDADTRKFFMLPAGYRMPYGEVKSVLDKGYSLIYEYIDELDETISGDLTDQVEVFKKLESLKPALLIASAKRLYDELEARFGNDKLVMSGNAVDIEHFNISTKRAKSAAPIDLRPVLDQNKPIVGYYGAMAPWLDYDLINELTHRRKDLSFVFIGVDYNGGLANLLTYDNVFYLGAKDYNDLPNYSYWFDAAIIPFQHGDIAKSTSPVKLFEYMAMGLPTVCTNDLKECRGYEHVHMSKDVAAFEKNLDKAISEKSNSKYRRQLASQAKVNTWSARAKAISTQLKNQGD